jgi:hypothetical protein
MSGLGFDKEKVLAGNARGHLPEDRPRGCASGLYSLHNETLGGLAPAPLTFTQGVGSAGVNCVYVFKIDNQKITAPDGIHANCGN